MQLHKIETVGQLCIELIRVGYNKVVEKDPNPSDDIPRDKVPPGSFIVYKYWKTYEGCRPRLFFEIVIYPIREHSDKDLGESLILFATADGFGDIFEWCTHECYAGSRENLYDVSGWDTDKLEENMLQQFSRLVELSDGK